jgi:hypothetical protein
VPCSDRRFASSSSVAMPGMSRAGRRGAVSMPAHPGHDVAAGGRVAPQREPALHAADLVGLRGGDVEGQPRTAGPRCRSAPGSPSPRPAGGGAAMSREKPTSTAPGVARRPADAEDDREPAAEQQQADGDHGAEDARRGLRAAGAARSTARPRGASAGAYPSRARLVPTGRSLRPAGLAMKPGSRSWRPARA